jgi:hypothetical protein
MDRSMIVLLVSAACTLSPELVRGDSSSRCGSPEDEKMTPTIVLDSLKVTDKALEVHYQIRNGSADDIWLCDDVDVGHSGFEDYIDSDGETLMVRRRLDVPMKGIMRNQPMGRYTRLRAHESRSESLLLHLPVRSWPVLTVSAASRVRLTAKRLVLEIGFHSGDLPKTILDLIKNLRELVYGVHPAYPSNVAEWFGGLKAFIRGNEPLRDRDECVRVPWTNQAFKGEQVLEMSLEDLSIPWVGAMPYEEPSRVPRMSGGPPPAEGPLSAPRFGRCTRAEIQYKPSMLEYFFPYASQQGLLSASEKEHLRSQKTLLLDDPERMWTLTGEIAKGFQCEIVQEGSVAHVVCYRDSERLASFTVYHNTGLETEDRQRFRYSDGLQSLRQLTPEIQPYELRMRCADNLRDLWYRLRFYRSVMEESPESSYVNPADWSAATAFAYRHRYTDSSIMDPYKCPSASGGECHYAMNPNCEPDSPADTVLLFETKPGWNQHGGPELFTFDNHDPKGGCVLLNDGTVKFIRTQEELKQLRWK